MIDNYSMKAKWTLLNNLQDEVRGLFHNIYWVNNCISIIHWENNCFSIITCKLLNYGNNGCKFFN